MGLDIHWALQEIYDYFYDNYDEINSFDNAGFDIKAYIKFGQSRDRDRAGWDDEAHYLLFGDGFTIFNPIASLDVISHEYGHAISDLKVGMPYIENKITAVLQEGISDIWGVILENAIYPNDIWKMGEQIVQSDSCTRNIANPTDPNALTQLITTYGSNDYNTSSDDYEKSGVMSYWFYLLVNGGSGTNALGNDYYLGGVGIEEASRFFTETIYSDYLTGNWSFEGMREAFTNSALFNGFGSYFKKQVEWAWYAVGVGNEPTQQSITGSYSVCNNGGTIYSIDNLLPGSTVQWTYSSNLISCDSGSDYIKLCQNSTGSGHINAIITNNGVQTTLPTKQVKVGVSGTLSGTAVIGYGGTGNYYISSTCANNYQWYLKKEGQGGYVLIQNSSSNSLALTSQTSGVRTYRIAPPPNTQTTFYLYAKVKDAYNGSTVNTNIKEITAQGDVNLVVGTGGGGGGEFPEFHTTINPNPVTNELTLKIDENEFAKNNTKEYKVIIYNSFGKKFHQSKSDLRELKIDVSNYPYGLYKIIVTDNNNNITTSFIVNK